MGTATYVPFARQGAAAADNTDPWFTRISDGTDSVLVSATGRLLVDNAGAGGTEYTEGDTDATITGVAVLAEGASDDLQALQVDASKHLQVDIAADSVGIGGGTQYTEDAIAAANPVGNAQILIRDDTPGSLVDADGDNVAQRGTDYGAAYTQIVTSTGSFVDTFGGGTQYTEADTDATITGTALMMEDAANTLRAATGDVTNGLDVDVTRVGGTVTIQEAAAMDVSAAVVTTTPNVVGGGTEAAAQRVTIANDSTGVLTVDQPTAANLNVTEASAAAILSDTTAILADTANMDTNLGTVAGAVAAGQMQVDIVADGAGLATAANQPAVYTDDTSTHATGTSEGNLLMAAATPTDGAVEANDIGAVAMSLDRRLHVDSDIVAQSVGNLNVNLAADAVGLATSANQLPDGHNVTVDNAAGASAVNIQDGGNNISVDWAGTVPPIGAGTEAAALRVTVATDSTGVLTVDQPTAANLNVTEASAAGILADTAAIQTAVELIDDTVFVDDIATHTAATTKVVGIGAVAVPTDTVVEANDIGMPAMSLDRRLHVDADIVTQTLANLQVQSNSADLATQATLATIDTDTGNIDTNTTNIPNVIGTDGSAGPTLALSIGGTESGGTFQEIRTDADGHLQVDVLTGGGGGTQYTLGTDTYTEATTIGTVSGVVRSDAGGTLVNTDNEITALQVDANGNLRVTGGGGGTEYTQDVAHADPATAATLLLPRDDALSTQEDADGDWTLPRANARGAQWVELDQTNTINVTEASAASILADTTAILADTAAIQTAVEIIDNQVHSEDDPSGGTAVGVGILAIRDDTLGALTPAEGDYVPLRVGSTGALHVTGGGGGTEYTQDVAHADPATAATFLMPRDDALSTQEDADGDWTLPRANARGAQWVELDLTNDVTIADGGNNISVDWAGTVPPIGAGTEAAALRVTVATDSTGVLTVDQPTAANLNVTEASAAAILSDTTAILADTAAIQTAVELIDDTVYTDDTSTHSTGVSKGIGIMAAATPTDTAVIANDIGMVAMSLDRRLHVDADIVTQSLANLQVQSNSANIATETTAAAILADTAAIQTSVELIDNANATISATDLIRVAIFDDSDTQITSFGSPTEYVQDATVTDPATAATFLMARDDVLATQETADNDWTVPRANARGAQWVELDLTNDVTIADGGNDISVDWAGTAPPIGAGTEAAALRVTVATDSTGVLTVDQPTAANLNVTEASAAAILADTAAMDTNLATIAGDTTSLDGKDLALGTDISDVFGTASLVLATQADNVSNASDGLQTTTFLYGFDGTTWDRLHATAGDLHIHDGGNNISVDWAGTVPPIGGGTEAAALRVTLANDSTGLVTVDTTGTSGLEVVQTTAGDLNVTEASAAAILADTAIMSGWDNAASDGASVSGDVAHGTTDAGEPVKVGAKALTFGADPTEVATTERTDLYATRAGQLLTLGGHPNILSRQFNITDADGAQTDLNVLNAVVAANDSCVVVGIDVTCDNANTGDVQCRVGFGTTNTPGNDALDVILSHPGIAAGSGISKGNGGGIIGFGASNEELRMTCEDPVGGSLDIVTHYFIMAI